MFDLYTKNSSRPINYIWMRWTLIRNEAIGDCVAYNEWLSSGLLNYMEGYK